MTPTQQIETWIDSMRTNGWWQGEPGFGPHGERCMSIAAKWPAMMGAVASIAINNAVHTLFPERRGVLSDGKVCWPDFNDDPATSFEDIELIAKHAIAALEATP